MCRLLYAPETDIFKKEINSFKHLLYHHQGWHDIVLRIENTGVQTFLFCSVTIYLVTSIIIII